MRPAWSVILFTTLAGAGQGLVVTMALAAFTGALPAGPLRGAAHGVALVLLMAGLVASTFHLGRPARGWRAAAMWRTSWLSREVIVLPAFVAVVAAGWLWPSPALALLALALALVLWWCTAMIYACLRFIQEWAHGLTIANFIALGLASGALLAAVLAFLSGEARFARTLAPWALMLVVAAWALKSATFARNASLRPKSTLASATGIRSSRVAQISMGFTGGSFNTREFFHGATQSVLVHLRWVVHGVAFAGPAALLIAVAQGGPLGWLPLAFAIQYAGLLAERWLFFAQARHPQNLYYQVVS